MYYLLANIIKLSFNIIKSMDSISDPIYKAIIIFQGLYVEAVPTIEKKQFNYRKIFNLYVK
jgi:hypothetical protein